MNNQYTEIYKKLPIEKLVEILENKKDYQFIAIEAATLELENRQLSKCIVYVSIVLTTFTTIVSSALLINFSPNGDTTNEYNALCFVFSAFITLINALTCLTALLCIRPTVKQNFIYYNLSLYGLLFIFNFFIILVCFPNNDRYYRTREIIELVTPFTIFSIGQTILGRILKKPN